MHPTSKIHFEISERKILLRIFDVASVFGALFLLDKLVDFDYFSFQRGDYYELTVLALYINILGTVFEMYNLQVASNQLQVIRSILFTATATGIFYLLTPFFTPFLPLNRIQIVYFFLGLFAGLFVWRFFYQAFLASHRFEKKVVLICDRELLPSLIAYLADADPHYRVVGYINPDESDHGTVKADVQVIGVGEAASFVTENGISEVVVDSKKAKRMTVFLYTQLVYLLENGVIIRDFAQVYESMMQRIPMEHFATDFYRYFPFSRSNNNKLYLLIVKALEMLFSFAGLVVMSVLLPFILLGNLLGNRGKLFYVQERVGKNGKAFRIYKFRTMVRNAEHNGAVFASTNDVRVTPFGKFLRKTRLDEMPQFINILKGDMAFIGPRPERPIFVNELSKRMPFYETRHVIKPGITGWAQVKYPYGQTMDDSLIKLQYDLYYIKHRSIFLDLNIIIKTFSTVLFYRGQ